ncbi:MAG: hypothetical protein JJD92_13580 [Frankiaceae bacterium]|nr:hypothetical protein [Frankiaceae bacterium]
MSAASGADSSPIGLVGRIVTASRGQDGPGEVELDIRGGRETFIAISSEPIALGDSVIVLADLGPRRVEVCPWDYPFASTLDT